MSAKEYIDLKDLFRSLLHRKYLVSINAIILASIFYGFSYLSPTLYKSEAVLEVKEKENNSNQLSELSRVFSFSGISGQNSIPRSVLAMETIKSRIFLNEFMTDERIAMLFFPEIYFDFEESQNTDTDNFSSQKIWDKYTKPTSQEVYIMLIDNRLKLNQDRDTGLIRISFLHESPGYAKKFLSELIIEANKLVKQKEVSEAKKISEYLYEEIRVTELSEIRNVLSEMLKKELSVIATSNANDEYILSIIDPPYQPEVRSSPIRLVFLVVGFLIGIFISILYVLLTDFRKRS